MLSEATVWNSAGDQRQQRPTKAVPPPTSSHIQTPQQTGTSGLRKNGVEDLRSTGLVHLGPRLGKVVGLYMILASARGPLAALLTAGREEARTCRANELCQSCSGESADGRSRRTSSISSGRLVGLNMGFLRRGSPIPSSISTGLRRLSLWYA